VFSYTVGNVKWFLNPRINFYIYKRFRSLKSMIVLKLKYLKTVYVKPINWVVQCLLNLRHDDQYLFGILFLLCWGNWFWYFNVRISDLLFSPFRKFGFYVFKRQTMCFCTRKQKYSFQKHNFVWLVFIIYKQIVIIIIIIIIRLKHSLLMK